MVCGYSFEDHYNAMLEEEQSSHNIVEQFDDPFADDEVLEELQELEIQCESCLRGHVIFGDVACSTYDCSNFFTTEYWREWYQRNYSYLQSSNELLQQDDGELTESHNLCCDQVYYKCECEEPIPWEEVEDLQIGQMIYSLDSECRDCAFCYTSNCLPFRHWLKDTYLMDKSPGVIDDICSQYVSIRNYQAKKVYLTDADCEF